MEHHFNIEFAKLYGIEEAIIVHNLYFWIIKNIANNVHEHNGKFWTYNSNNAFVALFPYMNKTKICRVMAHLESEGIIIKDNFNKDNRDRTLWYSFADEGINILNDCGYDISKMTKCTVQNELCKIQNEPPLPYNKQTNNKQEYKKENIDNKLSIKEKKEKSFSKKTASYNANADLSYVDAPYIAIWQEWLDYKTEIKKQYKTQRGAKSQYQTLIKYANNNPILANAIVKISIEHSWDGLFPLSDKQMDFFLSKKSPYAIEEKGYEASTNATQTSNIPNGWTKEQYDMYIRNGYTIADDGMLLKDGMFYK